MPSPRGRIMLRKTLPRRRVDLVNRWRPPAFLDIPVSRTRGPLLV